MRLTVFFLISISFIFYSCNLEPKTPIITPQPFDKQTYAENLKKERDSIKNLSSAELSNTAIKQQTQKVTREETSITTTIDTVHVKITYGKAIIDTVKLPQHKMIFMFDSDTANKLNLQLTSQDSLAKIQFVEIIDSKGNTEKIIGKESLYLIKEKGIHKVIVSESSHSERPWSGRFEFSVKLGW